MTLRVGLATIVLGAMMQVPLSQGPTEQRLRPASAQLAAEFSRIVGVRELSDGRLLVADAGDKRLVSADFATNAVTQIGREGGGPGEYGTVSGLFSLGPDSTMMPDPGLRRWVVLVEDRVVGTIPPDHPAVRASGSSPLGADERGRVLNSRLLWDLQGGTHEMGKGDSVALFLVTVASGAVDTVARLRAAPVVIQSELDAKRQIKSVSINALPLSVGEESLLFPDGWIAIARLDPYRVDWRAPDGRWIAGSPLPFREQPVDARERRAYLDRRTRSSGAPAPVPADKAWPETIPPFQPRPLLRTPENDLLVLRTPTASHPGHRYDRIDRRGRLVAWLELPETQRLAGFGRRSAYVIVTDDDGIQRLERHPWP